MAIFFYIINIAALGLLILWLYKASRTGPLKPFFFPALTLKILAGSALGLIFKYHYQVGDTLNYFQQASLFADFAKLDFTAYVSELFDKSATAFESDFDRQPRALLFTKTTSVLCLITNSNYWLISGYYSLFCFTGLWFLANRLHNVFRNKTAILLSLFLFPSVIFWSAGIAKESVALGAMALLMSSLIAYSYHLKRVSVLSVITDVALFILIWKLKYYYAGMLALVVVAAVITFFLIKKVQSIKASPVKQIGVLLLACLAMTVLVSFTNYNLQMDRLDNVIAKNHDAFIKKSEPIEVINYHNLEGNWGSIIRNMPLALFSGLFRPLPGDGQGWLSWPTKIENITLLLLLLSVLPALKKKFDSKERIVTVSAVLYCLGLAIFLALSTPNFGTLVRYKVGFLPVMLLLVTISNPFIKKINERLFRQ